MTKEADFDGRTYDPEFDCDRLRKQLGRVYSKMIDGVWRTLGEVSRETGDPESSISARLRDLRKPKFGGYLVRRRSRGEREKGLFEYQLLKSTQLEMFNGHPEPLEPIIPGPEAA